MADTTKDDDPVLSALGRFVLGWQPAHRGTKSWWERYRGQLREREPMTPEEHKAMVRAAQNDSSIPSSDD